MDTCVWGDVAPRSGFSDDCDCHQVHSFNSNVSVADWVVVISEESKIEFREKFLHGKIWSGNSRLDFQPYGEAENFSAQNNVLSVFEFSEITLQTKCEQIQISLFTEMFLKANRTADGNSYMEYRADQNVNLIFSSDVMQVNAFSGQWAQVSAVTWHLPMSPRTIITSSTLNGLSRQLHVVSFNGNYNINISVFGAQVQLEYGNIKVQIKSDYRFVRIRSGLYILDLKTVASPFKMLVSDYEMIVQYESEQVIVQLLPNSSNIIVNTGRYSRVIIDCGSDSIVLGSQEVRPIGNIKLLSMQLKILLKSGNVSSIHASANQSQITMQTTSTNMASTASYHVIDINGGRTNLHIFTGNISMDIVANADLEPSPTMLTPFPTPQDKFQNIRVDNSSYNFSTAQRNSNNNNRVSITHSQHAMASQSVSYEEVIFVTKATSSPETESSKRTSTAKNTSNCSTVGTTAKSIILLNKSSLASLGKLPTLETLYSSTSFALTTVASNVSSSSTVTVLPNIPFNPGMTLTRDQLVESITHMDLPKTSRSIQSFTGTSTTSNSGVTKAVVSGKESDVETWETDESGGNDQTNFIEFNWDKVADSSSAARTTTAVVSTTAHSDPGQSFGSQKAFNTECVEIELSEKQNIPLFSEEAAVMTISEATIKSIVMKTDRSIGSAWTPFASLPFEFPATARYPSTTSFRKNKKRKNEMTLYTKKFSTKKELNKSTAKVPSVTMITAVKEILGKVVQHGSSMNESQHDHENAETEFRLQQNFFSSSKFKRALSGFENEEIYELQLKVPSNINLTTVELHDEFLLALKKFVLFTSLHERRLTISEDAVHIKIKNMERNGEYLKLLYSVSFDITVASYANNCSSGVNKINNCAQHRAFSGINLLLAVVGIVIVVLSVTVLFVHHKYYKFKLFFNNMSIFSSSSKKKGYPTTSKNLSKVLGTKILSTSITVIANIVISEQLLFNEELIQIKHQSPYIAAACEGQLS
uniref:Uncharacterized protein n=1 Tax=Setaria digitata TaxID=48799 RepID=A0A915Q213_9BILA